MKLIALFGGTYDPVHNGHLALAETVLAELPVSQVRFIPCALPVHRATPSATPQQRLAMLKLATRDHLHFVVDDSEIKRNQASYSIDTIRQFRQQFPDNHCAWVLGVDAWLQFTSWHEWQSILENCHLIIASRPNVVLPETGLLAELLQKHQTIHPMDLLAHQAGKIFLLTHCEFYQSATTIRASFLAHSTDLPESVQQYVLENNLYQT